MNDLIKLKEEQGELSEKDQAKLKELKMNAEDEILRGADVICTTCATAFDRRLRTIKFRQVLIDEATQAIEPVTLVPILKGARHVVLVGDQC